jgi:glutamate racemase
MKIGVFDSGVGGKSFAEAINKALPHHEVVYVQDRENIPYGTKTPEQLLQLTRPIFRKMRADGCSVIVVACNTVSTTIIGKLRQESDVPLVAVEPMVKPASLLTETKVIAVCATKATLNSERYRSLIAEYAAGLTVLEPDCSNWAYMIENKQVDHEIIRRIIAGVCGQGADVIVLGCTHYHWIEKDIRKIAAGYRAYVIQPEQAVIKQLTRVLAPLG